MGRDDPGSKSAINKGCTCPVIDNNHGKGVSTLSGDILFWMDDGCPMHGHVIEQEEVDEEEAAFDKYFLPRA